MTRRVGLLIVGAVLLLAQRGHAQPRPVTEWADWASYGTELANPTAAAVHAWRSDRRGCELGRLAVSELIGNGVTLAAKRAWPDPRPCLGCAPDGMPSGHTMNSAIGAMRWTDGWKTIVLSAGLVAATGWLRVEAGRHTWRQVAVGALVGAGADVAGHLVPCGE